jgi:hypothetical protein
MLGRHRAFASHAPASLEPRADWGRGARLARVVTPPCGGR